MPQNTFVCDCDAIHQELVDAVLQQMPNDRLFTRLADFYKIMADPTRCKILYALQQQELCVCDLAGLLSMTKSSVSHQLAKLRSQGVVKCRRAGKEVYYSLDDDHIAQIFSTTMTHLAHKVSGGIV